MNDKRQLLLETALHLFYSKGVQAVGINEVLKVSGVAKKTLYHHFSSKEDLVLEALKYRDEKFTSWIESLLVGATSNLDLAERLFEGLSNWFNNGVDQLDNFRGCFFINTSAEYPEPEGAISCSCKAHKLKVRELISQHMVDPDEEFLETLCLLKEGAIVSAYVAQDRLAAKRALSLIKHTVLPS